MYLHLALTLPRTSFATCDEVLQRIHIFDASIQYDELRVQRHKKSEYIDKALVRFIESPGSNGEGTIAYLPSWTDESDGTSYPGYCELQFGIGAALSSFLNEQVSHGARIFLGVQVDVPDEAIRYLGPDTQGEYQWNCDLAPSPKTRIDRVDPVHESESSSERPPVEERPRSNIDDQVAQLQTLNGTAMNLLIEARSIGKSLLYIVVALGAISVALLFHWWRGEAS
ncbi:MAG: hypothetical protein RIQ60_341 [Pseudomonadota bacterium]|jgi:hypothetical protein